MTKSKEKIELIMETDGLLKDYIDLVVIKQIKAEIQDSKFTSLNANKVHAALILKALAPCTLKEFALSLRLSKAAASALVDRMVKNGVIVRKAGMADRREVQLTLASDFNQHINYVSAELSKWFEGLAQEMGPELFEKWYEAMTSINRIILKKLNQRP